MKKIEAIIRPSALQSVLKALAASGYKGVTVMDVKGHGVQKGVTETYRGQTVEGLLPKLLVMVVVPDNQVKKIIRVIGDTVRTGEIGDGKIFVSALTTAVRIRTNQTGEKAL